MKLGTKGQAGKGVGGLIALLILIAIGALVLYEVTGALVTDTTPSRTLTLTLDNTSPDSTTLNIEQSISSATLTTTLDTDNILTDGGSTILVIQLNGENIIVSTNENIDVTENTVTAVLGTNTITIANDNEYVFWTGTSVLTVNTYVGGVIEDVEGKGSTVLGLLTILAIVIVAALIIGVVMRAIGGVAGGARAPGEPALYTRRYARY